VKERPKGFLAKYFEEPQPDEELADYIQELHSYLWAFVRAEFPWANGDLSKYVEIACESAANRKTPTTKSDHD
jgi:hypothetical protein